MIQIDDDRPLSLGIPDTQEVLIPVEWLSEKQLRDLAGEAVLCNAEFYEIDLWLRRPMGWAEMVHEHEQLAFDAEFEQVVAE